MHADRWEQGSDFAYPEIPCATTPAAPRATWLPRGASFWLSGRHALRALVRSVRPIRAHFPSFYCQDVLDAADDVEVRAYADGPEDECVEASTLDLRTGDMLVVTNHYGMRGAASVSGVPAGVVLVEDHTHDPLSAWARTSTADFAFASLRKWLPLPDGGIVWSPAGKQVPLAPPFDPAVHAATAAITLDRLTGMLLKQRYLAGEPVVKDDFRARAIAGENAIGRGDPAPISPLGRALLDTFPAEAWRTARSKNHTTFERALGAVPGLRMLTHAGDDERCPYAAVLCFDDAAKRDTVRSELVKRNVYPAVLWPIDAARASGIPADHVELSRLVLCVHCDHRYGASDMERVAATVRGAM